MLYIIPIIIIGGIFVVFYLFKDKFMAKTVNAYNEAAQKWTEDKAGVVAEFYSNPDKLGMIRDAVEKDIDCIVNCSPKKGIAGKILKGAMEMVTMTETFDMSLCYLAIAGDEMHFLQSDGKMIVEHAVFDLKSIENVQMKRDSDAMKAAKYVLSNQGSNSKFYWLSFISKGEEYEFKVDEFMLEFASYTVDKAITVNRKYGQNPFSRVSNASSVDLGLLNMYAPESIQQFTGKIESMIR